MKLSLVAFIALIAIALTGCSDFVKSSTKPDVKEQSCAGGAGAVPTNLASAPFTREKMLLNIGYNVIAPWADDLRKQAARLELAVADLCPAIGTEKEKNLREQVENAWMSASVASARLEAVGVGPWTDEGLGSQINGGAVTSPCGLDRLVANYSTTGQMGEILPSMKGLNALEYVLYFADDRVQCNRRAVPEVVPWLKRETNDRRRDRCQVALILAKDLGTQSQRLSARWSHTQENYPRQLVQCQSSTQQAINMVSDSLFFLEKVKDMKLARPLGLSTSCGEAICPDMIESPYADRGLFLLVENLKSLQTIFHGESPKNVEASIGNAPYGFDDLLVDRQKRDLAERMSREIAAAITTAEELASKGSFRAQVEAMPESGGAELKKLFQQVRDISRSLRSDFVGALDVRPPRTVEGDND